jgi:hypothetical protein
MEWRERRLRFAKPKKAKKKLSPILNSKIQYAKTDESSYDGIRNAALGDMLGTGFIGGLDFDLRTPL